MRLGFLGSPAFALPALHALHSRHTIAAVYCQPPRPAHRGQVLTPSPVGAEAARLGLDVRSPTSLKRDPAAWADFAALELDAAVVVAYGLILPQAMLDAPRLGCLNIHASLLPRWRGAGPIQAAILAGDDQTGVTIMQMETGLDTGPMLLRETVPIGPRTTAATLHDELAALGARLILQALDDTPAPTPQPDHGVSYAPKLSRADGKLEWTQPATVLDRRVRGLQPWPGAWTTLAGETLKVLEARPETGSGPPGTTLDDRLLIACGEGALRLLRVQRPGRGPMAAEVMLRGMPILPGTQLA